MSALDDLVAQVGWPDHAAATRAHDALVARPEFGRLGGLVSWLAGVQGEFPLREITRVRLVIAAADHPVAATGVSRFSPADTQSALAAIAAGRAPICDLAALTSTGIRVVEVADRPESTTLVEHGAAIADDEIDTGADLLIIGNIGAGSTTIAAAVVSVLTATEPVKMVGRGGSQIDDLGWMHKVTAIRDARLRGWPYRSDPAELLEAIGAPDIAVLTGFVVRAAARRTPVIFDGLVAATAALVADRAGPGTRRWLQAAQLTGEPAQAAVLRQLSLEPLLDLAMAGGDGSGGLVALGVLQSALALARSAGSAHV